MASPPMARTSPAIVWARKPLAGTPARERAVANFDEDSVTMAVAAGSVVDCAISGNYYAVIHYLT